VDQPLHVVDWYPTLLRLAGASLQQPLPLDGRDVWETIAAGKPSPHDEILLNATPLAGAIRRGDWKRVINGTREHNDGRDPATGRPVGWNTEESDGAERVELFSLVQDPYEKTNLAEFLRPLETEGIGTRMAPVGGK
jgi:arylsulfatase A-like enzyme